MSFRFRDGAALALFLAGALVASVVMTARALADCTPCPDTDGGAGPATTAPVASIPPLVQRQVLRIAADPNNLPYSNERLEGFEHKIAQLIADELKLPIEYVWHAQRRGFFRETLKEQNCDMVLGVPVGFEMTLATEPYYRSGYVFVSRKDRDLKIKSLDDPRLASLKVGVQLVGDDAAQSPPAHALGRRGIVKNLVGFPVYGDYASDAPPSAIVDAVSKGHVDVAIVRGPLAGYLIQRGKLPLAMQPVSPEFEAPLPMTFRMAIGVRRGDKALRDALNGVLARKRAEIDAILDAYGIPRLPLSEDGMSATTRPAGAQIATPAPAVHARN
jgi:quinoprotein dehydrogenase-associated probable ABC transporter substrate-binding protein